MLSPVPVLIVLPPVLRRSVLQVYIHTCIIYAIHMYNTHGVYICLGLLDACICHYVCLLPMCIYTGCVYNETLYTHQQFFSDGPCIEWYAVAYTLSCIMLLLAIGSAVVVYSSCCCLLLLLLFTPVVVVYSSCCCLLQHVFQWYSDM